MEILIVVAIWSVVVKRGVEDLIHAARGNTPKRYEAARARRSNGAAGRYWGALWDDTFDDLLTRHNTKRARRAERSSEPTERPDTAGSVLRDFGTDFGHWARGTWAWGWEKAARRRQDRLLRNSAGKQTVPGEVVPDAEDAEPPMYVKDGRGWGNCDTCGQRMVLLPHQTTCAWCTYQRSGGESNPDAMRLTVEEANRWTAGPGPSQDGDGDEDGDGPQDGDGDGPDAQSVPDEDEDGDDQQPPPCPKCGTTMTTVPNIGDLISYDGDGIYRCPRCDYKIRRSPETTDDFTQEGPTTMTATTTEVVGLDSAIRFCEDSARAYRAQMQAIEQTQAALAAGGVTGPAAETFSQAMEQSNQAAASMDASAAELIRHKQVQEAYNANQGAGTREFVTSGQ